MPNEQTEAEKLAALDRAATQKQPMLLECVENGVWQIRLIFGEGEKNCTAMRQWADAYRTGKLVLIGPDAVERVARAIASTSADKWEYLHVSTDPKDWEFEATAALAALGVK